MNGLNVNMLAADMENVLTTLFLVAFAVVSVVTSMVQKNKAERERKEALERRRKLAEGGEPAPPTETPPLTGQRLERAQQAMREKLGLAESVGSKTQARPKRKAKAAQPAPEMATPVVAPAPAPVAPADHSAVNLHSREQLRRAMLFHEILSPPKALRKGDEEMWNS